MDYHHTLKSPSHLGAMLASDEEGGALRCGESPRETALSGRDDTSPSLLTLALINEWSWPPSSVDTILGGLRSPAAGDRFLAARLARHLLDDDIADTLLHIIESDDAALPRQAAADSLFSALEAEAARGHSAVASPLSPAMVERVLSRFKQLYYTADAESSFRRCLLEVSVRVPQAWHEGAIRAAYRSNEPEWRITAVLCMGCVEGFDELIAESLHANKPALRGAAAYAAGKRGLNKLMEPVCALLRDEHEQLEVRLSALHALPSLDPRSAAPILQEYTKAPEEDLAFLAAKALERALRWLRIQENYELDPI